MNQSTSALQPTQPVASIGIMVLCALAYFAGGIQSAPQMALWPLESGRFQITQMITYAFQHGSFNHLFFNMFAVWMFGMQVERALGFQKYVMFYFVCVVGAAITQLVVQQLSGSYWPTVGASGAVFGLLLAFGVMWPNNRIMLIFFPIPIKAKWFVLIYAGIELVFGLSNLMPQIAHFAHLGGLFFGAGLLYFWGWRPGMTWKF